MLILIQEIETMKIKNAPVKDILHVGRLGSFDKGVAKYTSSIDIDGRLLPAVIAINSAHVIMLFEQKIVDHETAAELLRGLKRVPKNLDLQELLEDVHMNVEDYLISTVGKNVGGMLNVGKSRNDQVATALRMTLREKLLSLGDSILTLEKSILDQAEKNTGYPMPGYTHLQRGQPVTLGHHLLAHFDSLDRNFMRLIDCYFRVNLSPMGAGALASSGFDIDRKRVAQLLGFDSILENSLDAVSSRDFATEAIYLFAQIMTDLSRLAEELILWSTKEFSFAEISDRHTSTSSMMPQKKNAIVPEIFRAKTSQVVGDLVSALGLLKELPLSFNLDLQELTRNLWSSSDKTVTSLRVIADVIDLMKFDTQRLLAAVSTDDFLYATELADYLVHKFKLPFREAHKRVGNLVKHCEKKSDYDQFKGLDAITLAEILCVKITQSEIDQITNPIQTLEKRKAVGSPNPKLVVAASKKRLMLISQHRKTLDSLKNSISESEKLLSHVGNSIIRTVGTKKNRAVSLNRNL